jgi:UDP-glucuronate decarboxylase
MNNKTVIFDKKNVLVTGGAGFIGSHICDELIKTSKVICLDDFSSGSEKNIDHLLSEPNFTFIKHDISEPIDLESFPELKKYKIEFQGIQEIYHLACPMSPKDFDKSKIDVLLANSYGVKNALDLSLKYKSKFLHFSSSVVYGYEKSGKGKVAEDYQGFVNTLSNRGAYDEGKRFAETMVANYGDVYKLDVKILRLFRTYGPRMKIGDGQMIPDFISDALDDKDLTIFGDEKFSSSFCYISDVVDAAVKIMESDLHGPYNIGSDIEVNLISLVEMIIKDIGSKSKYKFADSLLFMKPLQIPDISRARNELGWMPVVSLDKGVERTIYELRASKGLRGVEQAV